MDKEYVEECKGFKWLQEHWHNERHWKMGDFVLQYGDAPYRICEQEGGYCDACSDVWIPSPSDLIALMGERFLNIGRDRSNPEGSFYCMFRSKPNDFTTISAPTFELACLRALRKVKEGK